MTGSSIFDYVHQSDHAELAEQLGVTLAHQQSGQTNGNRNENFNNKVLGSPPAIPDGKST